MINFLAVGVPARRGPHEECPSGNPEGYPLVNGVGIHPCTGPGVPERAQDVQGFKYTEILPVWQVILDRQGAAGGDGGREFSAGQAFPVPPAGKSTAHLPGRLLAPILRRPAGMAHPGAGVRQF